MQSPSVKTNSVARFLLQQVSAASAATTGSVSTKRYPVREPIINTNLVELQQKSCKNYPNKPIFGVRKGDGFKWTSYSEFSDLVNYCRGGLAAAGVQKDNAIAVISNNRIEWAILAYAAYGLGAHIVPMYEVQKPSDWLHIVKDSSAVLLCVANKNLLPMATKWIEEKTTPDLRRVLCFEAGATDLHCFQHCLEVGKRNQVKAVEADPQTLCGLIYTSGTTGVPKGVELTHENIVQNINALQIAMKEDGIYGPNDVCLSFLPWAHVYGQSTELHQAVCMGSALGLVTSPQHILEEIKMVRPTILFSVPTLLNKIYAGVQNSVATASPAKKMIFEAAMKAAEQRRKELNQHPVGSRDVHCSVLTQKKYELFDKLVFSKIRENMGGRLDLVVSGGAALHSDVHTFFNDIGIRVTQGYGLTETSPLIAAAPVLQTPYLQGGMIPLPNVTVNIMDGDGNFLARGEEGEIVVSGPNVMKQYHGLPEATAEVIFEKDGKRYFKTGDMGILTKDHRLKITGRVKELYKLENGKWVAPVVAEMAVGTSRFVNYVMMYGVNRPYNVLLVVPNLDACAKQLGVEKCDTKDPKVVKMLMDDIKLTLEAGKIKKYEAPQRVYLVEEEFSIENGLLTNKLSMKRNLIVKKYESVLNGMYAKENPIGHALKLSSKGGDNE